MDKTDTFGTCWYRRYHGTVLHSNYCGTEYLQYLRYLRYRSTKHLVIILCAKFACQQAT